MTTTPQPTLTLRTPDDIAAAIPVLLGFQPSESLVILTFGGDRPFHARVDLPTAEQWQTDDVPPDRDVERYLDEIVQVLLRPCIHHGVESAILAVVSDHPDAQRIAAGVMDRADELFYDAEVRLLTALLLSKGRYWLAPEELGWHAGTELSTAVHPFAVEAVAMGKVTRGSRAELAQALLADSAAVDRVRASLESGVREFDGCRTDPALVLDARAIADLLGSIQLGWVRATFQTRLTRESAAEWVEFWVRVVRATPEELLPVPCGMLALSAWQDGDGAMAWCAVDRGRSAGGDHELLRLMYEVLSRAVPPHEWQHLRAALVA